MGKYKNSFKLEQGLVSAKRTIEKFESLARETSLERSDLQPEFFVWRKIRRFDASCSKSLAKETRLQEDLSLCDDRTGKLGTELLSCQAKLTDLESAQLTLENKKLALQQELLKVEEKIAAIKLALRSVQEQSCFLDNGETQLKAVVIEYESRHAILQSERKSLAEELAKVRVEISTLESQINRLTRDKIELSSEVVETMKAAQASDQENAKILCGVNTFVNFPDGENPNKNDRNETDLGKELNERKRSDKTGCDENANTVRVCNSSRSFSDRKRLIETSPDKTKPSSTESSGIQKDVETGNKLNADSSRVFDTSRSVNGENYKEESLHKTKLSSELSEARKVEKENQVNVNTLGEFGSSRRYLDGEYHKEKSRDKTKSSRVLSETKKDVDNTNQFSANTLREFGISRRFSDGENHEEKTKNKTESLTESSEAKKYVKERDQEKANDFRVFNTARNVSVGENREETTQKNRFFLESHSHSFGDKSHKFHGFTADLATSHFEEGSLEGDLMKLRAKLSTLESYINKLIQEKGALLAELNRTKENAEKRDVENAKILRLLRSSKNLNEGGRRQEATRKDQFFFQTHNENTGDEIRKIKELTTDLEAKYVICESDKKLLEDELLKLQANWISNFESYLHKLIRDKTALLAELSETKESDELRLINRSEDFASLENREETSQKERFFLQTHKEKSGDEVHKLRELAADLQTKYTTCKTELEKQKALIAAAISREEAATRAARESARELQLKLDESQLDIETCDVMVKTLREDKRRLESNIQEFVRNDPQKCDLCAAELKEIRALYAQIRKNRSETNPKLQDSKKEDQQSLKYSVHVEEFERQTNGSLGYDAHEQKRAALLNKRDNNALQDYAKHDEVEIVGVVNRGNSILQGADERRRDFYLSESLKKKSISTKEQASASQRVEIAPASGSLSSISKRANKKANFELKRSDVGYKRKYRECYLGELDVLKPMMAAGGDTEQMEKDLDGKTAEFNGKCEDLQSDIGEIQSESYNDATETGGCASVLESQEQSDVSDVVVSNSHEMMSMDGEVNGVESPATAPENGGFDTVTSVDTDADDFTEMKVTKESLQELCDVLMEERDRATSSLKEKGDEVLRLRKRLLESEQENGNLKNQLAKALGRSVHTEKEVVNAKEENAKLRAEIVRLTKRIQELEAENSDLKSRLGTASVALGENQTPTDLESVTLARVENLQEQPASSVISSAEGDKDKNQEVSDLAGKEKSEIVDEAKHADETKDSGSASEDVVRRRERGAKRTAPHYFRHSFAGSLPRPFHSHELPRQSSVSREDAWHHERSESFQSDTSGESESSEGASHPAAGIPSFMRRTGKASFIKSSYSPVQFNYQPLPESISHRRESWDPMRHSATIERARGRGHSLNRTHESSSDSESSGFGSLSREQHTSEINAAPDDLNGGHEKRADVVGTENYGVTIQVSSLPSKDSQRHAENSQNLKDLISAPTTSILESHASVPLHGEEHLESNDGSQVHAEEGKQRENVSELVNIWNSRTTEVSDV